MPTFADSQERITGFAVSPAHQVFSAAREKVKPVPPSPSCGKPEERQSGGGRAGLGTSPSRINTGRTIVFNIPRVKQATCVLVSMWAKRPRHSAHLLSKPPIRLPRHSTQELAVWLEQDGTRHRFVLPRSVGHSLNHTTLAKTILANHKGTTGHSELLSCLLRVSLPSARFSLTHGPLRQVQVCLDFPVHTLSNPARLPPMQ